ncbi:MAG: T9SS type A sorting domain-containing protein [Bacteroidota bacterium]
MRDKVLLFALVVLLAAGFQPVQAGQGGPDAYGYTWIDSDEPNGPSFSWVEIRNAPGAVQVTGLADDNAVGPFNFNGWTFRYYWTDISSWKLGSNGWVGMNTNTGNIAHCFPSLPQAGGSGDNFIAPFMTDINFTSSNPSQPNPGEVWYYDNGVDTLIIEWFDCPWWVNGNPDWVGSNTFQMILTSTDSAITWNYLDMDPAAFNDTQFCASDLSIGIENITGNIGLQVSTETVPTDSFTIRWTYPPVPLITVPDAEPSWNANSDNAGQFYLVNDMVSLTTNIENVGNADITNQISIDGELRAGTAAPIWTDATSLPSLNAGADSTLTFPNAVTFTQSGRYSYFVRTTNSQDLNPSNNENQVEVNVVECQNDTLTYLYAQGPPDGVLLWTGGQGNEGAGVYIEPASYPSTITAIDVFVTDPDINTPQFDGFTLVIYDDDGAAGQGTVLDSIVVSSTNAIDGWNRVATTSGIPINDGGFYIGWFQGGSEVSIGTETILPISRRSWEILAGQWAPYRQGTVEDLLLGAHVTEACVAVSVDNSLNSGLSMFAQPNPTNGLTKLNYETPVIGDAAIAVMDLYGQTVFEERQADLPAGQHSLDLDTRNLAAGVYFINLSLGELKVTKKLVVNR